MLKCGSPPLELVVGLEVGPDIGLEVDGLADGVLDGIEVGTGETIIEKNIAFNFTFSNAIGSLQA